MNTNRRGFFGTCAAAMATCLIGQPVQRFAKCISCSVSPITDSMWHVECEYDDGMIVAFATKEWGPGYESHFIGETKPHVELATRGIRVA